MSRLDEIKLKSAKALKIQQLKDEFAEMSEAPVMYNGVEWHGGDNSARKIADKAKLLEYAGETSGDIFDTSDIYHTLTIAEMEAVAFAIALDYETKLASYKQAKSAVLAATTLQEVESVTI